MPRYENTETRLDVNSNQYSYKTTFYLEVLESNEDLYFISQAGDRLDNLAYRFYGNPQFWWYIARINGLNTMNIPAGISLRIPANIENAVGI
tara:strand:- start:321 stop:596 length:276 start_codon:yes stop_codon:yes gene_type:complete